MSETINVSIGGQDVSVIIEGGALGPGMSIANEALNAAVAEAQQAAEDATVNGGIAGAASGATAGATAGAAAGTTAGTNAATAVVATKLDKLSALASLPAAVTGVPYRVSYRTAPGDGYAGEFEWIAGDQSANVAADFTQGVWVAPTAAPTGASGAFKRSFNGGIWLEWFGGGTGNAVQDQVAWMAATAYMRATGCKLLLLDSKIYYQTDSIYQPKGSTFKGSGKYDRWGLTNTGTILMTSGAGTARRFTDIDGADPANDTPQIVMGGNACQIEDITLITDTNAWSIGMHVPGVRQCGFRNVQAFGHTDACLYIDATWSSINTTLTALHPLVQSDNGPLEFTGTGCYMRGGGTNGFAVKIQGTTRAFNTMPWVWSPGGASDFKLAFGRLGSDATVGGGAISIDGQMPTTAATYIQGFTFNNCDLRVASAQYQAKFDRANRVILTDVYSEVSGGGAGEFAVTSRTQASLDGIIIFGDKMNSGSITVDGVAVTGTGAELFAWEKTRCVTRYRSDGRVFTPGITSSVSNLDLNLKSFSTAGQVTLGYDNGTSVTNYLAVNNTVMRPLVAGGMNLGSTGTPWGIAYLNQVRITPPAAAVLIAAGVVTATNSDLIVDTEGGAATDDLDTINGLGDGAILIVRQAVASRDVTLKDGTGNLRLVSDFTFGNANDRIVLHRASGNWFELSRALNG